MDADSNILLDRLVGWTRGRQQPPFRMEINPTERCNLACIFCKGRTIKLQQPKETPDDRLLEIVKQGAALGVRQWRIVGGGEPLARPVTVEIMTAIKRHGMTGFMITNGTLFKAETISQLVTAGWDNITVSLDGPSPEINDTLRGRSGAFESCHKVLQEFKAEKDRLGVRHPFISFHVVLCNQNYRRLDGMFKLAAGLNVGYIFVQPLNIYHEEGAALALDSRQQSDFQRLIPGLLQLGKRLAIGSNLEDLQTPEVIAYSDRMNEIIRADVASAPKTPHPLCAAACFEPWVGMVIRSNGNVGPCCVFEDAGENVLTKNLGAIWTGSYFTQLREDILGGRLPRYCAQCGLAMVMANKELRSRLTAALQPSSTPASDSIRRRLNRFMTRLKMLRR